MIASASVPLVALASAIAWRNGPLRETFVFVPAKVYAPAGLSNVTIPNIRQTIERLAEVFLARIIATPLADTTTLR